LSAELIDLVRRCQDGDEKAIAEIITIHKQLIFTIAYRMLSDYESSLDICQETFIKAFRNIHKLKDPAHIKTWLCCIARNCVIDQLRKRKTHNTVSLDQVPEPSVPDDTSTIRKRMIIQKALNRLKERDRMLLVLFYFKEMNIHEIASVIKIKPSNVKVGLCRARVRLRKELQDYENELMPK
jgi:RNA polymerase sigma factor (sigma-70 family)